MSRMSNPRSWHTRAASHITAGSDPKSCAEIGCSSGSNSRYLSVLLGFRAPSDAFTPCELVNSVMIKPQPPRLRMNRRNTVSVTPAIGASTVAGVIVTGPIERRAGNGSIRLLLVDFNGLKAETELALFPSEGFEEGNAMKPFQIALLVVAGAVGGAVVMKVTQRPQPVAAPATPAPVVAQNPTPAPAPQAEPVAPPPAAEPAPKPEPFQAKTKAHPKPKPVERDPQPVAQNVAPVSTPAPVAAPAVPLPAPSEVPPPAPRQPESAPAPPPPPPPQQVTLNAGMLIPVRLIDGLST